MQKIVFILNPISGTVSKAGLPELIERRLDHDRYAYEIWETQYAGHATELAAKAAREGVEAVVAVGGDGTVNEVGRALVGTETAMAILPCGSGNGLARHLLLPMSLERALDVVNAMEVHRLDYGLIDHRPFFCTCGMGFDAFISMKFAEAGKRGFTTYAENVLREGLKYKPETYEIEDEAGKRHYKAFLVSIANASQYGNNAFIAPQASMSDGLLDVVVMEPFDVLEAPQVVVEMMNKTLDKNVKIKTFRARHVRIHRHEEGLIHYDGDPVMAPADLDVSVVQRGIRVVVNPWADRSERQPNFMQTAFSELFYDFDMIRANIARHAVRLKRFME